MMRCALFGPSRSGCGRSLVRTLDQLRILFGYRVSDFGARDGHAAFHEDSVSGYWDLDFGYRERHDAVGVVGPVPEEVRRDSIRRLDQLRVRGRRKLRSAVPESGFRVQGFGIRASKFGYKVRLGADLICKKTDYQSGLWYSMKFS